MSFLDTTTFAAALKQRYPDWMIKKQTYKNRPLYALLPKFEDFSGDVIKFPSYWGNPQNVSATFSTANAISSNSKLDAFLVTRKKMYSMGKVSNEVMEASKGNAAAFMSAIETEVNGALDSLANAISQVLAKTGTGSLAQVKSATVPSTTITLARPEDAVYFEVGMQLVASAADAGSPVEAQYTTVTRVNRNAGTLVVDTDVSGLGTPWLADWYIKRRGDSNAVISGLLGWMPYENRAATLASTWYGVDRQQDDVRLAGVVYDATAATIEEGLVDGLNFSANAGGGKFDYLFVNPMDFSTLEKSLGSKVQRVQVSTEIVEGEKVMAALGFNALEIYYEGGSVKVLSDRYIPKNYCFAMQMDTWKLCSLGPCVRLFKGDGLDMLRSSNDDAVEFRCFSYANLYNTAPGCNAVIKIA